jgi:6-phosphogluconolactonase (cycloisomerase 2 family)
MKITAPRTASWPLGVLLLVSLLTGCGGGGGGSSDGWYYHWSCNGDSECLVTNPTGQAIGTVGPVVGGCGSLMTFGSKFWNIPPATQACDHSPTTPPVPPTLTSLEVTPAGPSVALGGTLQFHATGHYSDGSAADVTSLATWSTNVVGICPDLCVAVIGPGGVAMTYATGSIGIIARLGTRSASTTLTVTAATLQSISVTPVDPSVVLGATQQFAATGHYSDGSAADLSSQVTWASGTLATATVAPGGLATSLAAGTSSITATLGAFSDSTALTVTMPVLRTITVTPALPSLPRTFRMQLAATGGYDDGTSVDLTAQVTWASVTTGVATVSAAGVAAGVAVGTSLITATKGTIGGSTSLTVTGATLQSIAVTPLHVACVAGTTRPFHATGTFSDGTSTVLASGPTWSSSATGVATVSASGLATCVATGAATITATSGAASGSVDLVVRLPARAAYVVNNTSASVSQYAIGAGGALSPMSPATVATGAYPSSVAVDPSGAYAYVANYGNNNVSQYAAGATGALTPLAPPTVSAGVFVWSVTVDPNGRFAYAVNNNANTVSQYAIGASGTLSPLTPASVATDVYSTSMAIHPSGRYAYVASALSVSQYAIGSDGTLTPLTPATVAAGSSGYDVAIDPSGRYAYVAGSTCISQYAIGPSGTLTPLTPATVGTGRYAASVAVDPSGRFAYAATCGTSGLVSQYAIGPSGSLTPLTPATVPAGACASAVGIDPSGRYAYVADSGASSVSQFTIGASGALTPMGAGPVASGNSPSYVLATW